jgi:nucleotide-binding universal stress UspA family protein
MQTRTLTIVVGVSRARRGWDALEWASAEAHARGCPLRIVHVVTWPWLTLCSFGAPTTDAVAHALTAGQSLLEEAAGRAARIAPDSDTTTVLELGDPASWILRIAADEDLIVLGRKHRRRWRRPRARSTVTRVARRAAGAVAIIGLRAEADGAPAARIVALADGGSADSPVMDVAFDAARRRGLGLTIVRPGNIAKDCQLSQDVTRTLAEHRSAFPDVHVAERVLPDPIRRALLTEARGAALLAVGHGLQRPNLAALLSPANGSDLVPVVIVRTAHTGDFTRRSAIADPAQRD